MALRLLRLSICDRMMDDMLFLCTSTIYITQESKVGLVLTNTLGTYLKGLHKDGPLAPCRCSVWCIIPIIRQQIRKQIGKCAAIHALELERVEEIGVLGLGHCTDHTGCIGQQLEVLTHSGHLKACVVEALVPACGVGNQECCVEVVLLERVPLALYLWRVYTCVHKQTSHHTP